MANAIEPRPPSKPVSPFAIGAFALMIVAAVGLRVKQEIDLRRPHLADLTIRGKTFTVEIADTAAKKELGLGKRDVLEADHGMYFPFANAERWMFWMKDMRIPIDIVWIRQGKVIDVHHDVPVPTGGPLETYSPIEPADAVFELNAGIAEALGVQPGDEVFIGRPGARPPQVAAPSQASAPADEVIDEPGRVVYGNEASTIGSFISRPLDVVFTYPREWGLASARDSYLPTFDTGKAVVVMFADRPDIRISLFSHDYAQGIGEGWPARFQIRGDGPVRTLTEAQKRIFSQIVDFRTIRSGYRIAFNGIYGAITLQTVLLAPDALKGEWPDVEISIDPDETMQRKPEDQPFMPAEAAELLEAPAMKARLDAVERLLESLKSYPR